jgi:long-chain fatty acid transport protein
MKLTNKIIFTLLFLFCNKLSLVYASGFAVYTQGAKELGMLNAVVAHTEGPASNFYNPALLTKLEGTQLEIGTTLIFPDREFKSDLTGETADGDEEVHFPSTFYISHPLNEQFVIGFGVFTPFGLGTEWPNDWEGRYITTEGDLMTFDFNPNIAWKVTDRLSLSGGLDYLHGDGTLKRKVNLSLLGLPDGEQKFDGDGDGWGFNVGASFDVTEKISLGLSYRSQIDLDLDGDLKFNLPSETPPIFNNTGGKVELELPAKISFGVSFQINDKLLIEASGRWEDWSVYDEIVYEFDEAPVAGGESTLVEVRDWDDTWGGMIGVRYSLNPTFLVSAGYLHEENPIPDETFEPLIPDSDKDMFSIGFQKIIGKYNIAFTYIYALYDDRDKDNLIGAEFGSTANGEYSQDAHFLSGSLKVNF